MFLWNAPDGIELDFFLRGQMRIMGIIVKIFLLGQNNNNKGFLINYFTLKILKTFFPRQFILIFSYPNMWNGYQFRIFQMLDTFLNKMQSHLDMWKEICICWHAIFTFSLRNVCKKKISKRRRKFKSIYHTCTIC